MQDDTPNKDAKPTAREPETNPYAVPVSRTVEPIDVLRAQDQTIFGEPWLNSKIFSSAADPAATLDHPAVLAAQADRMSESDLAEHSVWDEPSTFPLLRTNDDGSGVTWFRYYEKQVAQTPLVATWLLTGLLVLLAGPLAVLGALLHGAVGHAFLMIVFFGPTTEEVLKIALPLWVVEKRPWLFASGWQILLCGVGAGLVFAALENLLYLYVYFPNASQKLVAWRWTVCVALHTGCSALASVGLIQVRSRMLARAGPPQLYDGGRWIVAAIVVHGTYNTIAIFLDGWF